MKCASCEKSIDDDSCYWENEDGEYFCSEDCLDDSEKPCHFLGVRKSETGLD